MKIFPWPLSSSLRSRHNNCRFHGWLQKLNNSNVKSKNKSPPHPKKKKKHQKTTTPPLQKKWLTWLFSKEKNCKTLPFYNPPGLSISLKKRLNHRLQASLKAELFEAQAVPVDGRDDDAIAVQEVVLGDGGGRRRGSGMGRKVLELRKFV